MHSRDKKKAAEKKRAEEEKAKEEAEKAKKEAENRRIRAEIKKNGYALIKEDDGTTSVAYTDENVLRTLMGSPTIPMTGAPTASSSEEETYSKTYTREKSRFVSLIELDAQSAARKEKEHNKEIMLKQLKKMHCD